jgi:outer membrane protein
MKSFRPILCLLVLLGCGAVTRAAGTDTLTLSALREQVLRAHPRITVAALRSLAAGQTVVAARSGFFPFISANATGVGTGDDANTRIAAGSLNDSQIYDRAAVGASFTQLITDFGRTANLTDTARLRARAAATNVLATRMQLLLQADGAYFAALSARAVKAVAARTLTTRQLLLDQVAALASNQLKSELDVRFAQVGVDDARLLADKAETDWQSAQSSLAALLGRREPTTFDLVEEPAPGELPAEAEPLVVLALARRPDLAQQRFERDASRRFARAQHGLSYPTISAFGSAGIVPLHDEHFVHEYAAAGVNLNLPLFAGGLNRAKQREADLLADAADAALADAENNAIRDVRVAWLEAGHARERIILTAHLLASANAALDLARARYEQGLSSIVELSQAELSLTSAALAHATAEYEYRARRDLLDYQTGDLR